MQKIEKKYCGCALPLKASKTSIHKIFHEQKNIFSCGGAYLKKKTSKFKKNCFSFLVLSNYFQDVMVLNHLTLHRLPGKLEQWGKIKRPPRLSSQEAYRFYIKESLN